LAPPLEAFSAFWARIYSRWFCAIACRPATLSAFLQILIMLLMAYVGLVVGANKGSLLNLAALGGLFGGEKQGRKAHKILDTSVIIDGRISDIAETGFLDGVIVIPQLFARVADGG